MTLTKLTRNLFISQKRVVEIAFWKIESFYFNGYLNFEFSNFLKSLEKISNSLNFLSNLNL